MGKSIEGKIQREIARRAFEKSDLKAARQKTRYTLEALEEITGLSPAELQAIETEVRERPPMETDRFFTVTQQIMIAVVIVLAAGALYWL